MQIRVIAICAGFALLGPLAAAEHPRRTDNKPAMSRDMQEAITFQRAKDRADARQAALEARHPSVQYGHAERSAEENQRQGRKVPDPGEKQWQRHQQ